MRRVLLAATLLAALLPAGSASVAATPSADAPGIAFLEPRDFATDATPSSAAFNAASGDQAGALITRVPLSDHVAVGDFDHDGRADVAQTNVIAGSISVFLGDGAGGFAAPELHAVGVHPVFVLANDLDVDGHLDLAVANVGSDNLAVLRGGGDGTFTPATFIPVPQPRNIAAGNFDGDSRPDLAVSSAGPAAATTSPAGGVAILLGDATPVGFHPSQVLTHTWNGQPARTNHVAVGDFDGNGRDDIAVGVGVSRSAGDRVPNGTEVTGDDILIHLNTGALGAPFPTTPTDGPVRVGAGPDGMSVRDFDGDTDLDIAVMDALSGDVTTLVGDGHGGFDVRQVNVTVGGIPRTIAAGDLDGDGITDLVTANFHGSTISALKGNGDGTFQPAVEFWSGDATTSAAVGHFDGDGGLDVVVGRLRDDELGLLINDSPQRGDGVDIRRNVPYGSPTDPVDDPLAAHHTLDVYIPPPGTTSIAGGGRGYPVLLFAHGSGVSGDKTMVGYLMRSLARTGIVAVSTDYRLGPGLDDQQTQDIAQALRYTRDNIRSIARCADPDNLFVAGHSAGAGKVVRLGTEVRWADEQRTIRGMVFVSSPGSGVVPSSSQPPSLLVSSTEGLDAVSTTESAVFAAASSAVGASARHVIVPGRDHFTVVAALSRAGDPGGAALLDFVRANLAGESRCSVSEGESESRADPLGERRLPETR